MDKSLIIEKRVRNLLNAQHSDYSLHTRCKNALITGGMHKNVNSSQVSRKHSAIRSYLKVAITKREKSTENSAPLVFFIYKVYPH